MTLSSATCHKLLRYAFVVLFLWFGVMQLVEPSTWTGYLPTWTGYFPIPAEMLVQLNGWLEVCLALLLALGTYTRFVAALLSAHLAIIAITAGGAVGMRDAVLAVIGLVIALQTPDDWTVDASTH